MSRSTAPFNMDTITALVGSVKSMAARMTSTMHITLTSEEFIGTYIDPVHVPILHEAQNICGFVGNSTSRISCGIPDALLSVYFLGEPPIILPDYIRNTMSPDAPHDVVLKVQDFVNERVSLGHKFGRAVDALYWLNSNCRDVGSFRVMFPALPALLATIDPDPKAPTSKRAVRLATVRSYAPLPVITSEARQALRDASALLQACSMLAATSEIVPIQAPSGTAVVTFTGYVGISPNVFNPSQPAYFV